MGKLFSTSAKVDGLDPLLAFLDGVKRSVRNKWFRRGLTKGARVIAKSAKAKLKPAKDADGKTIAREGLLKKSITIKVVVDDSKKKAFGIIGPKQGMKTQIGTRTRDGKKSKAGDPIFEDPAKIAHLVEYGHGGPHPAPPHPFMRPAWDENKAAAQAAIADEITRGIAEVARGKR